MQAHEQVSSALRTNLDMFFGLAGAMAAGAGKLAELNARFARSALKDAFENAQNSVARPHDWLSIQSSIVAATAEKVQSYSSELFEIVSSAQGDVLKAARTGSDAYVQRVQTLVEDVTKNAPAGSEAAVAAWNSAIIAANTLYQTLGNTGQQAVEVARSNFDVIAAAASKNARRATESEQQAAKR
ncbi:phasin family protein [Burkholderia sp. Bp8963]|uniref:TIGR01841 family phasin n=1 Tax=Burkholderia sp. Bp8963 TaxID=2184547 RepID=UPI000F5AE50A|nr:TIGR01841 family phasin [Burkholderia sp. Bp8963]RQS68431.1 phasin family protein [Burkholderia sp. Bp8963]